MLLVAGSAPFQEPSGPGSSQSDLLALSRNPNFVQVSVSVKDRSGRLVDGLSARDFTLYEDGVPQKLIFFSSERPSLSVAVLVESVLSAPTLEKIKKTLPKPADPATGCVR